MQIWFLLEYYKIVLNDEYQNKLNITLYCGGIARKKRRLLDYAHLPYI
jgi:hypothetical protein